MAAHSSILAWEIPWAKEPGGPQSVGSQRVRHDIATEQHDINSGDKSQLLEKTDTYEKTTASHISMINCRN